MVAAEGVAISAIMAVRFAVMQAPGRRLLHQVEGVSTSKVRVVGDSLIQACVIV